MSKLFNNEDSDSDGDLNINTDYATNYDNWRQKEELHKLKTKYGDNVELLTNSGEDESSETSDDDEGEKIPQQFEKSFYKTLACLKNKDPRIYNEEVKFFDEPITQSLENGVQKEKKEKSLFLRDYERKMILERGGVFSDSEEENEEKQKESQKPTYVQEQQKIKDSFKHALQEDEDSEEDLLLKPKNKSKDEKEKEDEDYKEWLKGQKEDINEEEEKDLKPLKDFWTDPNLDANEKFLRDYVLNKKFLEKNSVDMDEDYDHVIHDSDDNLSEDERNIEKQEEFEHKYNFRFEEPDQEFIKRFPRTLENSLRKKDTRRAQKRAEIKARKEDEKKKKLEDLKQLKAMKRKEIEEKIDKLKEITGNNDLELSMMDLEGDFDPDEYDKKMKQIFNEQYYAEQEDEAKPEFPEIDEELCVESTWDDYDPTTEEIEQKDVPYHDAPHCEDADFNMDADYKGKKNIQDELIESTKKRKRRRRSKFAEMISKEKPKFDPTKHSSYKDYYDQYYALDYEDLIGDLPCRFKYREVVPNNFGLSIEEILMADDRELNSWCSLKKALEYKPRHRELNEVKTYKQKASNEAYKRKILKSLYSTEDEEPDAEFKPSTSNSNNQTNGEKKKRKRKRKNKQNVEVTDEAETTKSNDKTAKNKKGTNDEPPAENVSQENGLSKSQKKKKRKLEATKNTTENEFEPAKKQKANHVSIENKDTETVETKTKTDETTSNTSANDEDSTLNKSIDEPEDKQKKSKNRNKNKSNKEKGVPSKKELRKEKYKKMQELKNKRNKKYKSKQEGDQIGSLSEERLKAYGLNPKKFKNKLKYMNKR